MGYLHNLKKLGQWFLDLLFPMECLICGVEKTFLCDKCYVDLPRLDKQQCLVCQTPAPFGKTHINCVTKNSVDGIISALSYKNKDVNKIIETFKYNFVSDLAHPLSQTIIEEVKKQNLAEYFADFLIISVPLHSKRYNWRGFNQAQLLSENLSQGLNLKIANNLVSRIKFTKPQIKLSHNERKRNIENAFVLNGEAAGKKFLLVDDVVTTGATLNEIAKLLKKTGAREVWALTAAQG